MSIVGPVVVAPGAVVAIAPLDELSAAVVATPDVVEGELVAGLAVEDEPADVEPPLSPPESSPQARANEQTKGTRRRRVTANLRYPARGPDLHSPMNCSVKLRNLNTLGTPSELRNTRSESNVMWSAAS